MVVDAGAQAMSDGTRTFVVQEAFSIERRGVILVPEFDLEEFDRPHDLEVKLVSPGGETRVEKARLTLSHARLLNGGSKWTWVLILQETADKPPPGSKVTFRISQPG